MDMYAKYPELVDKYSDISYPIGWEHILKCLFRQMVWQSQHKHRQDIANQLINVGDPVKYPVIEQVKEKFGMLRVYVRDTNARQAGMIVLAEELSGVTCEVCGSPGTLRNSSWLRTLCDTHHNETT